MPKWSGRAMPKRCCMTRTTVFMTNLSKMNARQRGQDAAVIRPAFLTITARHADSLPLLMHLPDILHHHRINQANHSFYRGRNYDKSTAPPALSNVDKNMRRAGAVLFCTGDTCRAGYHRFNPAGAGRWQSQQRTAARL